MGRRSREADDAGAGRVKLSLAVRKMESQLMCDFAALQRQQYIIKNRLNKGRRRAARLGIRSQSFDTLNSRFSLTCALVLGLLDNHSLVLQRQSTIESVLPYSPPPSFFR